MCIKYKTKILANWLTRSIHVPVEMCKTSFWFYFIESVIIGTVGGRRAGRTTTLIDSTRLRWTRTFGARIGRETIRGSRAEQASLHSLGLWLVRESGTEMNFKTNVMTNSGGVLSETTSNFIRNKQ